MGIFDFFRKKKAASPTQQTVHQVPETKKSPAQPVLDAALSKDEWLKRIVAEAQLSVPSDRFASGAVFDIFRHVRDTFQKIILANDAIALKQMFAKMYALFCEHPEVVGFSSDFVDMSKNDTDPRLWNADIMYSEKGEPMALCFIPVQQPNLEARIVGIVLNDAEDRYYYCMLNKEKGMPSRVFRNKAWAGIEEVGEVRGRGFELMNNFVEVIQK